MTKINCDSEKVQSVELECMGNEVVIRHGKALDQQKPIKVQIAGNIASVHRFLVSKCPAIPNFLEELKQYAFIEVDRDKKTIVLNTHPHLDGGYIVTGRLTISPEIEKFSINTGKYRSTIEMSDFICK